jgi:hypothetical protein
MRTPPAEQISVAKESLGDKFVLPIYKVHGVHSAIIQIFVTADCDLRPYKESIVSRLDCMNWEWVTLRQDKLGTTEPSTEPKIGFGMAPILPRQAEIAYHVTLERAIPAILKSGLLPSCDAIKQTDFPDTEGRIHVTERLEGDGSAARWIRLFSEKYDRPQADYGILELNLQGLGGRMYQDIHSEFGLVIDGVDRIAASRIKRVSETDYELEEV